MKSLIKKLKIFTVAATGLILSTSTLYAVDQAFNVSITILTALGITKTSDLSFPTTASSGSIQAVTVAPADGTAATFDITGEPSTAITASIVEADVTLTASTIVVDTFTFGGGLAADGTATTTAGGAVAGAAVGATANIPASHAAGSYSGSLTFRVLYQ